MSQNTRDFVVSSVLTGELELLNVTLKEMEKELTHKESGGFYWADIQFHKDDIRDLQKVISWICGRIKQIKE